MPLQLRRNAQATLGRSRPRRRTSCAASKGASKRPPGASSTNAQSNTRRTAAIAPTHVQPACQFVKRVDCQKFVLAPRTVLRATMTTVSWLTQNRVAARGSTASLLHRACFEWEAAHAPSRIKLSRRRVSRAPRSEVDSRFAIAILAPPQSPSIPTIRTDLPSFRLRGGLPRCTSGAGRLSSQRALAIHEAPGFGPAVGYGSGFGRVQRGLWYAEQ